MICRDDNRAALQYTHSMKIEGPRPTQAPPRTAKSGSTGEAGSFARLLESGSAGDTQGTSAASATNAVGGVFMLQGDSDSERKRRKAAISRGEEALSLLDQITYALLNHNVNTAHLARLKAIAGHTIETVADPRLAAVLDEIDLRLAVETAKLEKAAESLL